MERMQCIIYFMLIFSVKKCWCQAYYSGNTDPSDSWFAGRHQNVSNFSGDEEEEQTSNVLKISEGKDKGKPVTVPDCGRNGLPFIGRIVGGKSTKLGEFPWAVLICSYNTPMCGGTILNERWILTAAHCFKDRETPSGLSIKVGMIDSKVGTIYKISKLVTHSRYNHDNMENSDIALLKTAQPIRLEKENNIQLINGACLPLKYEEPKGKILTVVGWGRVGENADPSRVLKQVQLDLMNPKECSRKFSVPMVGYPNGYTIYKSQLCAYTQNKDACQGDSGGPAIEFQNGKAVLVGVVSFGVGCATDFPGVYTKVSYYLDWIASHMK